MSTAASTTTAAPSLTEEDASIQRPHNNAAAAEEPDETAKRKNASFKITNILPSRPPSNDPEESGEDDPDDSHAEDISDTAPPAEPKPDRRNSFDAAAAAAAAVVAGGGTKEAAVSLLASHGIPASAITVIQEASFFVKTAKWVSSVVTSEVQASTHGPRDRFKVVKMESTEPLRRGRWTCIDFVDKRIPKEPQEEAPKYELSDPSGTPAADASETFEASPNNIPEAKGTTTTFNHIPSQKNIHKPSNHIQQQQQQVVQFAPSKHLHVQSSPSVEPPGGGNSVMAQSAVNSVPPSRAESEAAALPGVFRPQYQHPIDNEHLVERLEEISTQQNGPSTEEDNDNGAAGTNAGGAIDNRIEQAMDLVKSHLMNAVRSEVEELKEKIVKLEEIISNLETENDFLKAHVSQEVLKQLPSASISPLTVSTQQQQQQPSSTTAGGTPSTTNGGLSPTSQQH